MAKRLYEKTRPGAFVDGRALPKTGQARKKMRVAARQDAIRVGLVPKARTAFALYTADAVKQPTLSKLPWKESIKKIAKGWKELSPEAKGKYQQMSRNEWATQHRALQSCGLLGARTSDGGLTPSAAPAAQSSAASFGPFRVLKKEELGSGTYGRVVLCAHVVGGRRAALKVFTDTEDAAVELAIYQKLQGAPNAHLYILPMVQWSLDPPMPWLALTYMPATNLGRLLRKKELPMESKRHCVCQLAEGLSWMHGNCVVHMDLKPGNLLWDSARSQLCIIDFGMSLEVTGDGFPAAPYKRAGVTAQYRPPELWAHKLSDTSNCPAVDTWGFGCTVAEIFLGGPLMKAADIIGVRAAIKAWVNCWRRENPPGPMHRIPFEMRPIVWWCLAPNPQDRPAVQKDVAAWRLPASPCG